MNGALHSSEAEVDLAAYASNLAYAQQAVGNAVGLVAVVKADGYGLGAVPLGRRALDCGAAMLGVATVSEAVELRHAGIDAPILVLMQPEADAFDAVIDHKLVVMLCHLEGARMLNEAARAREVVVPVQAMVDTGMGRQGFAASQGPADLLALAQLSHVQLAGVGTHYPVADSPQDPFTGEQIARLKPLVHALETAGLKGLAVHGANSAGTVSFPDTMFTHARPGIMCVGVWPTDAMPDPNPIKPVLRWTTRVTQVRTMAPGDSVSYARTYITEREMVAAMLPVGYADGYRLAFSNRAEVLIRGQRCPVRGRVCMDQTVVDVSHVPGVAPGDEVVLAGVQEGDCITLEELAEHARTIPYEILTGIGRRVARVYVN